MAVLWADDPGVFLGGDGVQALRVSPQSHNMRIHDAIERASLQHRTTHNVATLNNCGMMILVSLWVEMAFKLFVYVQTASQNTGTT